jgi:hypothetical protein
MPRSYSIAVDGVYGVTTGRRRRRLRGDGDDDDDGVTER